MKKFVLAILLVIFFQSCVERNGVVVSVYNPTDQRIVDELVCLDYCAVMSDLGCADDTTIVILDHSNTQVPYSVMGDSTIVFRAGAIEMYAIEYYRIVPGVPLSYDGGVLSNCCDSVAVKYLIVTL